MYRYDKSPLCSFQLQMYELVNQMRYEKLTLSRQVCNLLKQKKTREYLVGEFQKQTAIVVWDVADKPDGELLYFSGLNLYITEIVSIATSKKCTNCRHISDVID